MSARRKITVNVPADVLADATRVTGKGITDTIIEGLLELRRRDMRSALRRLKGKVRFELIAQRLGPEDSTARWKSPDPS